YFFFFQAEDGIRDGHVTGVQTCALPILFTRSPCRNVNTVLRRQPRSSSTTRCVRSRATRQARLERDAPPVAASAAATTSSGGSAIVASCAHVAQRWDCCSRSAVQT